MRLERRSWHARMVTAIGFDRIFAPKRNGRFPARSLLRRYVQPLVYALSQHRMRRGAPIQTIGTICLSRVSEIISALYGAGCRLLDASLLTLQSSSPAMAATLGASM